MPLSKRLQHQALADRLAGLKVDLRAEYFSGIRRTCWERLCALETEDPGMDPIQAIYQATAQHPERFEFLAEMARVRPGESWPTFRSLEELYQENDEIEWLWKGWLPRGYVSLLGAAPGVGKSLVALDLVRRLIGGMGWPDEDAGKGSAGKMNHGERAESAPGEPGSRVVYVEAESAAQILSQRARNWGMDMARLFPFVPAGWEPIDLSRAAQREALSELCWMKHPQLLIVDALSSACLKGLNHIQNVREVFSFLTALAAEQRMAVLVIHHLRKPAHGRRASCTIHDFSGSFYIAAMARSVMGLSMLEPAFGLSEGQGNLRRLAVVKSNLVQAPPALRLEILPGGVGEGLRLRWEREELDAENDWMAERGKSLERCMRWLITALEGRAEGVRVCEVIEWGVQQGFSRKLIFKARRALGGMVMDTHGWRHPRNGWRLTPAPGGSPAAR